MLPAPHLHGGGRNPVNNWACTRFWKYTISSEDEDMYDGKELNIKVCENIDPPIEATTGEEKTEGTVVIIQLLYTGWKEVVEVKIESTWATTPLKK